MSTSLEDRIRDTFAQQAERTVVTPDAEFRQPVSRFAEPQPRARHWVRPVAAAAVAVAVLGTVVFTVAHRGSAEPATETDISPVSIVAPRPATSNFPFEVGVPALPPGWRYIDLSETETSTRATAPTFLFRNRATGAVIAVEALPDAQPPGEYRDVAEGLAEAGAVTYALDGAEVWFRASGIDVAAATDIATSLILNTVDDRVEVGIDASTGFELEWSRPSLDEPPRAGALAEIVLETPTGGVTIELDSSDPGNLAWNHFGVPSPVGPTTVYTNGLTVTGNSIEGQIAATMTVTDPADLPAARELFASLQRVGVNMLTWDEIADQVASDLARLPVTATLEIADLIVTEHRSDDIIAACATWHGVTRCRSSRSSWWSSNGGARFVNVVVDGLWVVIGRVAADGPIEAPTEAPAPGSALGVWRPTDTGAITAYAVPTDTELNLSFDGVEQDGSVTSWAMTLSRPVR